MPGVRDFLRSRPTPAPGLTPTDRLSADFADFADYGSLPRARRRRSNLRNLRTTRLRGYEHTRAPRTPTIPRRARRERSAHRDPPSSSVMQRRLRPTPAPRLAPSEHLSADCADSADYGSRPRARRRWLNLRNLRTTTPHGRRGRHRAPRSSTITTTRLTSGGSHTGISLICDAAPLATGTRAGPPCTNPGLAELPPPPPA